MAEVVGIWGREVQTPGVGWLACGCEVTPVVVSWFVGGTWGGRCCLQSDHGDGEAAAASWWVCGRDVGALPAALVV